MEYTVEVRLGPDWSMTSDSRNPAPDPAAGVWTLDNYRQSWTMPDEWPAQPDPATAVLQLGAVDQALLPPLEIGTPVTVVVTGYLGAFSSDAVPVARFDGRISDAVVRTRGDGLVAEVTCVDYTADLRELYVGAAPWPAEYPNDRMDRIMAAVGLTWGSTPVWDAFDSFRPLDVDHRPVAEVIEDHLAQLARTGGYVTYGDRGWQRGVVYYHVASGALPAGDPDPAGSIVWEQVTIDERTSSGGPLVLTMGPEGVTVTPSPTPATEYSAGNTRQVPADLVDLDVEWRRDKGRSTNRAVVSGEFAGIFGELGESLTVTVPSVTEEFPDIVQQRGPVTVSRDSTLQYIHAARLMASMYLGAREDLESRWSVESFRLHVHRLEDPNTHRLVFPLFPSAEENGYGGLSAYPVGASVVVYGIRPTQNPAGGGREWMAGQLVGADLTVEGGKVLVDCHLRPSIPRPIGNTMATQANAYDALSWMAAKTVQGGAYAATTWAEIDPDLTWQDLRVTRSQ